jgi:uncharacterized membrane protein (DUF2068 family)
VTGMAKAEGMVVVVEELLAMDVLKRIDSVTMWENKFWSHHLDLVVVLGVVYIPEYVTDYNRGVRSDLLW